MLPTPLRVLGLDFSDAQPGVWEHRHWVIASVDTLKRRPRLDRLVAGPRWDVAMVITSEPR